MCRFKSGIILKDRVIVAQSDNDSHEDLLSQLGIEDNYIGASKTFVKAELVPLNNGWWVNPLDSPEKWHFVVDQDIIPNWFNVTDAESIFRASVCDWWTEHVLVDKKIDELTAGYYRLKRCTVKKLRNDVRVLLDSSQVGEMRDSSQVGEMLGSSQVGEMRGSSQVGEMLDSSQVGKMWGSSQVGKMWDSSQVGEMWGSSQVGKMLDSSQVGEMRDSSQVGEMWDSSTVRDFKTYPNIRIIVPDNDRFKMITFTQIN